MNSGEDDEPETVLGYIYTHWDCPCGEDNQSEGDLTGEERECPSCGTTVKIERVQ